MAKFGFYGMHPNACSVLAEVSIGYSGRELLSGGEAVMRETNDRAAS